MSEVEEKKETMDTSTRGSNYRDRYNAFRDASILYASLFLAASKFIPKSLKDELKKHWTSEIREAIAYVETRPFNRPKQIDIDEMLPIFQEALKNE